MRSTMLDTGSAGWGGGAHWPCVPHSERLDTRAGALRSADGGEQQLSTPPLRCFSPLRPFAQPSLVALDRYVDDWISRVYGNARTIRAKNCKVRGDDTRAG